MIYIIKATILSQHEKRDMIGWSALRRLETHFLQNFRDFKDPLNLTPGSHLINFHRWCDSFKPSLCIKLFDILPLRVGPNFLHLSVD